MKCTNTSVVVVDVFGSMAKVVGERMNLIVAQIVVSSSGLNTKVTSKSPLWENSFKEGTMDNFHKHKCPTCGYVWEHDPDGLTFFTNKRAHKCVKCGDYSWSWYHGDDPSYGDWDRTKKPTFWKRVNNLFKF